MFRLYDPKTPLREIFQCIYKEMYVRMFPAARLSCRKLEMTRMHINLKMDK